MKSEYVSLAPAPIDEWCAQVGTPDYHVRAAIECYVFRRMLLRLSPVPEGAHAEVIVNRGSDQSTDYREVGVTYENEAGAAYALRLEGDLPPLWDDVARAELDWLSLRRAHEHALASRSFGPRDMIFGYEQAAPPDNVEQVMQAILTLLDIPRDQRNRQSMFSFIDPAAVVVERTQSVSQPKEGTHRSSLEPQQSSTGVSAGSAEPEQEQRSLLLQE